MSGYSCTHTLNHKLASCPSYLLPSWLGDLLGSLVLLSVHISVLCVPRASSGIPEELSLCPVKWWTEEMKRRKLKYIITSKKAFTIPVGMRCLWTITFNHYSLWNYWDFTKNSLTLEPWIKISVALSNKKCFYTPPPTRWYVCSS